ncbi:Long-chain fatty acid transport protein 4, partial [Orchesella cincta]
FTARHLNSLLTLRKIEKNGGSVGKVFDDYALKNPEKIAFLFHDEKWTFRQVFERSNKIANFFAATGIKKQDTVALFMDNRIEYICTWLGLSKIGAITALINFNLRSHPLKHSFQLSNSKAIVCGSELLSAVDEIYPGGTWTAPLYISGKGDNDAVRSAVDLDRAIQTISSNIPKEQENTTFQDGLFLMYTSGTTGLPKAAVIKHARFLMGGIAGRNANSIQEDDIIYTTLPLYHTNAGILGVSQTLICGTTLALRKFSARNFWSDCIRYRATAAQYMGETCRYLLRQPSTPEEKKHSVRLMFGNGLRAEIWEEFVKRFNIRQISEIYGSTEGNASCVNYTNKIGACGFVPLLLKRVFPLHIAKLGEDGNPKRDAKTGLLEIVGN